MLTGNDLLKAVQNLHSMETKMNYTPEQISQIVLKVLKEIEVPDISKLSYEKRVELARDPSTPIETLKVLATDEHYVVRSHVAENPNTPVKTLKLLSTDESLVVRIFVAKNPNTSVEILNVLSNDKDYSVRSYVAKNPNTPVEALKVLATDEHYVVRNNALKNLNYKTKTIELSNEQYEALKKLIQSGQDESLKGLLDT